MDIESGLDWKQIGALDANEKSALALRFKNAASLLENCAYCQWKYQCGECPHLRWERARRKWCG